MRLLRMLLGSLLCLLYLGAAAGEAGPTLTFQKIIGDMRGKQQPGQYLSVAVDENGTCYLLSQPGRVAIFARDGKYLKSEKIPLDWPFDYRYLAASGARVFCGDYREDYPWVFSPQRVGSEPGKFLQPSMVAYDSTSQQLYVADTGNKRMQRFSSRNTDVPNMTFPLSGKPRGLAVRGTVLAVITDDQQLTVYDVSATQPARMAGKKIEPGARCIELGPEQTMIVVYGYGYVKKYAFTAEGITEVARVTAAAMDDWPRFYPSGVPLTTGPDGQIWFATDGYGKLLSLDPATDVITERGAVPWRTVALGFGNKGQLYVAGYAATNNAGPAITVYPNVSRALGDGAPYWKTGALYAERGVPIWGLLPDDDGSVYVRVVEEGHEKGWPTLAIKKITPEGTITPILEFKSLFAKRTKFGPSEANYALKFDAEHNLVMAALPLLSVMKCTPSGKILWEACLQPLGGADKIDFTGPRDLAIDRHGNIWVADVRGNRIYCLSPAGKLLLNYGRFAGVDDTTGEGFDGPTGIAVATVDGKDYLYVGDAGNQRLVKFRITMSP